jgi:uncharacterized protein YfiM (DUF2279 family)
MRRFTPLLLLLLLLPSPARAQTEEYGVDQTWTSRDKFYHFGVSAVGAAASYSLARALGVKRWPAVAVSVSFMGGLGVLREVQDVNTPGKYFSKKDLLWDAAGITIGVWIPDRVLFGRKREKESPG